MRDAVAGCLENMQGTQGDGAELGNELRASAECIEVGEDVRLSHPDDHGRVAADAFDVYRADDLPREPRDPAAGEELDTLSADLQPDRIPGHLEKSERHEEQEDRSRPRCASQDDGKARSENQKRHYEAKDDRTERHNPVEDPASSERDVGAFLVSPVRAEDVPGEAGPVDGLPGLTL